MRIFRNERAAQIWMDLWLALISNEGGKVVQTRTNVEANCERIDDVLAEYEERRSLLDDD